ncbi:MAG TPA: DUF4175 family protein [Gemmatimonadales bacterium]|nr:DUF4175 family protein [Gemmatimonadales bacterium]
MASFSEHKHISAQEELLQVVRTVRTRWRLRVFLRGAAILALATVGMMLLATYGIDRFRFDDTAVLVFRVLLYAVIGGVAIWYVIKPQLRDVSDERVALYLEEHEPSLDGEVLSAVEFGRPHEPGVPQTGSTVLIEQVIASAVDRCRAIDDGKRVDRPALRRSTGVVAGSTAFGALLLLLGPAFLHNGAPLLLMPWRALGINPYRIVVEPGSVTVPRGSDLTVSAQLRNFDADEVDLVVKSAEAAQWDRWPMTLEDSATGFSVMVFDLSEPQEYFVEASGVRSPVFRVDVVDLPYVKDIAVEYHFPGYTGLPPQTQEGSGDVIALTGTRAMVHITSTLEVNAGVLLVEPGDTVPLTIEADGTLTGTVTVREEGTYRVLLESAQGDLVVASPDYLIDPLSDQPPSVSFAKPGRDISVSSLEEVSTEVHAQDDYGVATVDLVYAVNGGEEQTLSLWSGNRSLKEVSAGHTFFLEELELEPGDFISYYAKASDGRRGASRQEAVTDIYFMEIRPFDQSFRQADQQPGQGMSSVGGELSERQRQIIAATFRIVRDSLRYNDKEFREHMSTVTLSQGRLREEVTTLVERMRTRGVVGMDSTFALVAEALPKAIEEMEAAEAELGQRQPKAALPPEQRALQQLQRAEAAYREVQVGFAQGGGAPGQDGEISEELADLFELELDRMRNQYEQVQRGNQQAADQTIDDTLEKLKELARRQQQENERLRARAQAGQPPPSGGGGGGQRRLADEVEQEARRLEQLAREQSMPDLAETARGLREAAEAMRRAASARGSNGTAQGSSALEELREARRRLERTREGRLTRDIEDARQRAERLLEQERRMMQELERLDPANPAAGERLRQMVDRKGAMAAELGHLEEQLDQAARDARRDQTEASRRLGEAAGSIRDNQLKEKLLYSRGVIQGRSQDYARNFEEQIRTDLEELRDKIDEATGALGPSRERNMEEALDRAREAVTGLESLGERMEQRAESGAEGQPGQESDPERRLRPGQQAEGQQGQAGEPAEGQQQAEEGQRPRDGGQPTATGRPAGQPGRFSPEDVRQWRREADQRRRELQNLRNQLRQEGIETGELDRVLSGMRDLGMSDTYEDTRSAIRLQRELLQSLKEFEYGLRRALTAPDADRLEQVGSDKVPPEYRDLVEEYYRALAGGRR